MEHPGLRERSKARRRREIQCAALKLFAGQGFEATTIAEIAEAAEVSPRTIFAYFPTKLDIATSWADELASRVVAVLREQPDLDIVGVVGHWLAVEQTEFDDPELRVLSDAAYAANPMLNAVSSAHISAAIESGDARFVAEFAPGVDPIKLALGGDALLGAIARYVTDPQMMSAGESSLQALLDLIDGLLDAIGPRAHAGGLVRADRRQTGSDAVGTST